VAYSIPLLNFPALVCIQQKLNSFIFTFFRTLCEKTPGCGGIYWRELQKRRAKKQNGRRDLRRAARFIFVK